MSRDSRRRRRGFVTLVVLWVVVIASVVIAAVQATGFSQAAAGREAMARVRAHWAARAGVEAAIARLEYNTESPDTSDAYAIFDDLAEVAGGALADSSYSVEIAGKDGPLAGPADAHAKLNINLMSRDALMTLPFMTEDVADGIIDWIDSDDDPSPFGAEIGYYQSAPYPYEPRNAPMRSLPELELVAGVYPEYVRGEDWNLNGRLDPNEDDGDASWPPDNADGALDAGWSQYVTASSMDGGLAASGEERLDLTLASESDLMGRTKITNDQATAVLDYVGVNTAASLGDFIRRDLATLASSVAAPGTPRPQIEAMTDDQVAALLDECSIPLDDEAATDPLPGRLNINTCDAEVLEYLPEVDAGLADAIIAEREARRNGFASLVDLKAVPSMTRERLARIYPLLDVRSNVFIATSRGRDARTGIEVEMMVTLDRSSLPVVISEVLVR